MDIGYNFIEASAIRSGDFELFDDRMSIVRFLQALSSEEDLPRDVSVRGLDVLLYHSSAPEEVASVIRQILVESVNRMIRISPVVQFVVEGDLQQWEHPEIEYRGKRIPLRPIFGGSLRQMGVQHYYAELNILS